MRRWNGWGDEAVVYPLSESALTYLRAKVGAGVRREAADFDVLASSLPLTRLPSHELVNSDPGLRLRHSRGQSLPDWIELRSGKLGPVPDAVSFPESAEDVRTLLGYARGQRVQLIPYGGGTSVVGHINPLGEFGPALTVSLRRMNQLLDLDTESHLATFGAGVNGPEIEAQLSEMGFTLGHFPQSWEYSTLGGWIATRSSGQQSYFYGRIEDMFRSASIETPTGPLSIPATPASAAGPDLRQAILGSEGRLGLITRATVRVRPKPETEQFHGAFFPDWQAGIAAARAIAQERVPLSMLRLSDPQETETTLALAGHDRLVSLADWGLKIFGIGTDRCLMIYGLTGSLAGIRATHARAKALLRSHGGLPTGQYIGRTWEKSRFRSPYLRNTLWEEGYALDTLESAVPWENFERLRNAVLSVMRRTFEDRNIPALIFSHLSHIYEDGVSFYVTYLYPRQPEPELTLDIWKAVKHAASEAIVTMEGTISHQHGVGLDHRRYLDAEKSQVGMDMLRLMLQACDPDQILNPGKLLCEDKA